MNSLVHVYKLKFRAPFQKENVTINRKFVHAFATKLRLISIVRSKSELYDKSCRKPILCVTGPENYSFTVLIYISG